MFCSIWKHPKRSSTQKRPRMRWTLWEAWEPKPLWRDLTAPQLEILTSMYNTRGGNFTSTICWKFVGWHGWVGVGIQSRVHNCFWNIVCIRICSLRKKFPMWIQMLSSPLFYMCNRRVMMNCMAFTDENPPLFSHFFSSFTSFFLRTLSQKYDAFSHNEIRKTFRD